MNKRTSGNNKETSPTGQQSRASLQHNYTTSYYTTSYHITSYYITSNGGCRREEKSRKHWSLFTMLLSSVADFFFRSNQKQLYVLTALKIREK